MSSNTVERQRLRITGQAVALGVLLAAAWLMRPTSGPEITPTPEPLPRPSVTVPSTPPDPRAAAAAYQRYWSIAMALDGLATPERRTRLAAVTGEPLLSSTLGEAAGRAAAGLRQFGTVVPHPMIVRLTAGAASIVDCLDASHAGEIDIDTGLAVRVGSARSALAATLARGSDDRWRVIDIRELDDTCTPP